MENPRPSSVFTRDCSLAGAAQLRATTHERPRYRKRDEKFERGQQTLPIQLQFRNFKKYGSADESGENVQGARAILSESDGNDAERFSKQKES